MKDGAELVVFVSYPLVYFKARRKPRAVYFVDEALNTLCRAGRGHRGGTDGPENMAGTLRMRDDV